VKKLAPSHIVDNRAARFHYDILERFEAGVVLTGPETKSCRTQKPNLKGAYISLDSHDEAWLKNCDIPAYRFAKDQPHERMRARKLLLSKKEIARIARFLNEKGVSAVPLNLHMKRNKIKVEIALGRGKKRHEKREAIKKRDIERDLRRSNKY